MTALLDHLPQAVRTQLTRRSLWGTLPRPIAPAPAFGPGSPPLLAFSFDLDYQADTDALPGLLDLLAEAGVSATMFSIGRLVQDDPAPYRRAAEAGHEIGNHTWSHPDNPVLNPDREFWHLSEAEMVDEIGRAQDALERGAGRRPTTFRAPHFKDAWPLRAALAVFPELTCVSSALDSKCPRPTPYVPVDAPVAGDLSLHFPKRGAEADALLMLPLTACPGLRWSPFCSYSGIREPRNAAAGAGVLGPDEWERRWSTMLERAAPRGYASVYFDPLDVMRDDATRACFRRMIDAAQAGGWRLTTLAEVEAAWRPVVCGAVSP